jgi:hypothetical protein
MKPRREAAQRGDERKRVAGSSAPATKQHAAVRIPGFRPCSGTVRATIDKARRPKRAAVRVNLSACICNGRGELFEAVPASSLFQVPNSELERLTSARCSVHGEERDCTSSNQRDEFNVCHEFDEVARRPAGLMLRLCSEPQEPPSLAACS